MDVRTRSCLRCGTALSRYNPGVRCAACTRAALEAAVPAALWELAPIRESLLADDVAAALVAARQALGISQAGLAHLLSDEAVTFSQAKVSRIEAGAAVKDIDDRRRISDVLGIPAELLGLASRRSFARASLALRPRVSVTAEEALMQRRMVLTGAAALIAWSVGGPWTELAGRKIGAVHVQQVEEALTQFRALDDRYGGDGIHELAAGTWQRVRAMLDHGGYTGDIGRRLHVLSGRLAEHAGWLSFDAGRQDQARYYLTEALTAARTVDDADLEVMALGSLSLQASRLGRLHEAVAFARRVQESPAARRMPVALVMAASREARGHALARDESAATDAMLRADQAFSRAGNRPDWFAYLDEAQLAASFGYCWVALGRPRKAVDLLDEAVRRHRGEYRRNRALWSGYLARAHLANGDLDQAAAVGLTALTNNEQVTSSRALEQITALRTSLAAHPRVAVARDYVEQFDTRFPDGAALALRGDVTEDAEDADLETAAAA